MTNKYDLVIVGAGPAGAMAAKTAGENGLRVALLERRKNIEKITRPCAEGLLCHKYDHGEYVMINFRDNRIVYPYHGFSIKYEGTLKGVYKFINYSADGHTMEMRLYLEEGKEGEEMLPQHVAIDKGRLINGLLSEARENHVEIFPGVNVSGGAEKTDEGVIITGNDKSFKGSFALAADGLNSRMTRQLGFNKEREFFGTLMGKVWHMRGVKPSEPNAHIHIVEGKDTPPLFCICPRAVDEYFVMVGGYTASIDFDARLNQIMKESWFSPWFEKAETLRKYSCVLNLFSPIAEPFKDTVLLIGDACAFGQLSTHNAILAGWKAANAITASLMDHKLGKEGISGYLAWWKKNFYDPHRLLLVDFIDILTREEINFVFSLFKEPIPASSRIEDTQKVMAEAMAKIMPPLQSQRPDIFAKITDLKKVPAEETWAERRKSGFPNK